MQAGTYLLDTPRGDREVVVAWGRSLIYPCPWKLYVDGGALGWFPVEDLGHDVTLRPR